MLAVQSPVPRQSHSISSSDSSASPSQRTFSTSGRTEALQTSAHATTRSNLSDVESAPRTSTSALPEASTSTLTVKESITNPQASSSSSTTSLIIVNGKVVSTPSLGTSGGRAKKFICQECGKGYTRPARLQEHERTHTGERPFKCTECPSTFTRDSHLKAHLRIHSTEEDKRYECDQCDKKFWTSQHLKKHIEVMHQGKTYDCSQCDESYRKHHQLRTHIAEVHSSPGTFPFICDFEGCGKSFKQNTHLKAHVKTHDPSRYLCVHPDCASLPLDERQHPNWSALQKHAKAVHPPTCPFPECDKKTFSTARGLRNHLVAVHEEASGGENEGKRGKRKRRRARGRRSSDDEETAQETDTRSEHDDETASDWEREDEQREDRMLRDFASGGKKKRKIVLAPESVWKCTKGNCKRSFKSSDALDKHIASVHGRQRLVPVIEIPTRSRSTSQSRNTYRAGDNYDEEADHVEVECDDDEPALPELSETTRYASTSKPAPPTASLLDLITGHGYVGSSVNDASGKKTEIRERRLPCPWLQIDEIEHEVDEGQQAEERDMRACEYWFSRVYDVQRHLKSEHGVVARKDALYDWFEDEDDGRSGSGSNQSDSDWR